MPVEIPTALEDIDAAWLSTALSEGGLPNTRVGRVQAAGLGVGAGFMGQLARLTLEYDKAPDDAPTSLIAKLPTADPGGQAIGQMLMVWDRESHFYREVAPHIELRIPRCYFNAADPEQHHYALLLEDMAPLTSGDQLAGASVAETLRVIENLAGFHATWWEDPRLAGFDWMPAIDGPLVGMIQPMFEGSWTGFRDLWSERLPAQTLEWTERFAANIPSWMAAYANDPRTIAHGDFRLDNMFFGDRGEFALIDWQMSMRSPGMADVVYFLATNVTPEVRRECEMDVLKLYREKLLAGGVPEADLDPAKLEHGYDEGLVFFTVMMASGLQDIDPGNERGAALLEAMVTRAFTASTDREAGARIDL